MYQPVNQGPVRTMNPIIPAILFLLAGLCGCSKPSPVAEAPRAVRVFEVKDQDPTGTLSFSGDVRARYESKVGFRVGGKIVRRAVNVGDRVKTGQVLAELDPTDYRLAVDALNSQLVAALSELEFAQADLRRYKELLDDKLIASAEYDRRETAAKTLRERVATLKAQQEQAGNQVKYTRLIADHDALVASIVGEAGQGQTIAVLAQTSDIEVAIDIPELQQHLAKHGVNVLVNFWAQPEARVEGRLREISASADPAARTFATRVSLPHRPDWVQIGMSATVVLPSPATPGTKIPLSAVFQPQSDPKGSARVWVVNAGNSAVQSVPVEIRALAGTDDVVVRGLTAGTRIVSAGTSRLREGQVVSALAPFLVGGSLAATDSTRGSGPQQPASTLPTSAAVSEPRIGK